MVTFGLNLKEKGKRRDQRQYYGMKFMESGYLTCHPRPTLILIMDSSAATFTSSTSGAASPPLLRSPTIEATTEIDVVIVGIPVKGVVVGSCHFYHHHATVSP